MKHIIAVLLENEPGALSRVVGLFSARGYNIESLTVAPTEDASLSRMTIVTTGSDEVIEQITKHLNRLIEVDEESRTATLEPGLRGPEAEALLGQRGYTIGHHPQSFEYATIGGFAAARSALTSWSMYCS